MQGESAKAAVVVCLVMAACAAAPPSGDGEREAARLQGGDLAPLQERQLDAPALAPPAGLDALRWAKKAMVAPLTGAFSTEDHAGLAQRLMVPGSCSEQLSQAVWTAELSVAGRHDAPQHFLNGALKAGVERIKKHEAKALEHLAAGRHPKVWAELGAALHAMQSFYAHTNYVELMALRSPTLKEAPVFKPWSPDAETTLAQLQQGGLVGACDAAISSPSCPQGAPSREALDKRNSSTAAGGRRLAPWPQTGHQAAVVMADRTGMAFLRSFADRYPFAIVGCGEHKAVLAPIGFTAP